MATQTSLYVDVAIIVLVFLFARACCKNKWNVGLFVMLGLYLLVYSFLVLFSRKPYSSSQLHLDLFWSYRIAFDGLKIKHLSYAREILLNILVYIPLGIILSAVFRESSHTVLWPVLIGLFLSVLTETIQYVTAYGIAELDDLLDNGMGLLTGMLIMKICLRRLCC